MIAPSQRPPPPGGPYLVAGLGVAGVAAAEALAARVGGGAVALWGRALARPLTERVERLGAAGVAVRAGGDGLDLLDGVACVVKSPGIPDEEPLIAGARDRGLTLLDEAELGWRLDDRPWIGVTGTNGKSTVCALVAATLDAAGRRPVVAGNSEGGPALSSLPELAADVVVAELSSFQLRHVIDLLPEVAVLTNCTHDSWHRHGGREGYERDKARIALDGARSARRVVLPSDDALGARLVDRVRAAGGEVVTFGVDAASECRVVGVDWTLERAEVELEVGGRAVAVRTRLPGAHNALNVAAAFAVARAADVDLDVARQAIEQAEPVGGRLERVSADAPFDVLIDYAHNPDGLARALAAIRRVLDVRGDGRLIAVASALPVFDDPQYTAMGRIVGAGADVVVATTERLDADSPLEEPPAFFAGLRETAAELVVEPDRAAAIDLAVSMGRRGDVVLILGRGRRRTPIHPPDGPPVQLDDRRRARAALAARMD